ncbi:MAG: hypothetical protein ACO20B_05725, partial [Burkholderiaceae bacterium]
PLSAQQDQERMVAMENPAGILRARVYGHLMAKANGLPDLVLAWAAYERSAQIFMQGCAQIYNASKELVQAVKGSSQRKP